MKKHLPLEKKKVKTYYNYLIADDTAHSRGHVGLYKEVALTKVYDKIDMRYYFEGNSLRYDYILKPGANASQINMQLEGSDHSYLNSDGEWIFETRFGEVKNTKLLSYQIINGEKKVIPSKFKKDAKGNITFELGAYDDTKELVIDPLVYSTFIGGHDHDYATAIIVDDSGQVYMVGRSLLFNGVNLYPVTPGAYVLPINGNPGLYEYGDISKFSADGSMLLFSTTFNPGSVGNMRPSDIELGLDKSINVAGYTSAMGFYRGFFLKLTPDGAGLLNYQQYEDSPPYFLTTISSMRIDSSKATFFTGSTLNRFGSPIWPCPPITDTFFHDCTIYWSASRAFVAKLDSNNNIVFSSSFGGSANGKSIEIDSLGNVYVVGDIHQSNPNFPYPSSNDSTYNGGSSDVFLAKYNPNGVLLNFSYLGGSAEDKATCIKLDKQGNIYILGHTKSNDFPTTIGCISDSLNGYSDVFISKFDPSGVNLLYSTYFGGSGGDFSSELQLDSLGNYIFSGFGSGGLPTTAGCYDSTPNGNLDCFVTKLNPAGDSILYCTYLGGNDIEYAEDVMYSSFPDGGLALDKNGDVYINGATKSGNSFPTTLGSYHQAPCGYVGYYDIFVSKLKLTPCPVVVAMASANSPLCVGGSLNLSSNMTGGVQPYSYHWYGPNGFTSLLQNVNINNITLADSGIYAVQVTDANGCNSSATVLASMNAVPSVIANNDTTLCEGQTLDLTVNPTPNASYNWTGPNGFNSALQNPSIANVTMAATGVFTITVTSANGCTNSDTINVIINPLPTVVANNDTTLCQGQTLNLTVTPTPNASYNWTGPNGFNSALQNPSIANVTMAATGVYTITVTSANGCTNSDTTSVIINLLPTVMANNDTTLCEGQTLDLTVTATPGATYNWSGPNGFTSAFQNPSIANVTMAANGVYTINVTSANGCTNSDSINVIINTLPAVMANNDTTLCEGQTLDLTVTPTPGATYYWSGPNGFSSALQNPSIANVTMAANGVYTITVTSANGCTYSDTASVIISLLPTVIANNDTTLCEGQTLDLTVTPTPGATYNWSGPNGFTAALQNPSIANVSMAANGVYTITVSSPNACTNSDTTNIIINLLPTVMANNDTTLCEGQTLDLTVTPTPGATYNWSGPNGFTAALQNPSIANVSMAANGVYTITVTSANGCTNSDSINVIINPLPTVIANNDTTLCQGQTLNLTVTPTPNASYNWTGPNGFNSALQNPSIANVTMAATGVFTITVTSANGCSNSDTTSAIVNPLPTVMANNDTTLCEGQTLYLTVTPTPSATYNWSGPNGFTSALQNPSIANVTMAANGDYTVEVIDSNGCSKSDTTNVKILVCTGIAESTQENTILIFPNPNNGTLYTTNKQIRPLRIV
jgi:hypothetical protein